MKIQPQEKNIKGLIGDQTSYFSIPDYQRAYRWNEEHINDFWNDITTAYDNNEENYFLGSLILIRKPENNDFEVVDGQQRLTTITIFLAVLRDHFAEHGKIDLAQKIQNEFIFKDGKYRLQIRPEDRLNFENHFLNRISSLSGIKHSSMGKHYINAVRFIQDNIRNKSEEFETEEETTQYLANFYEYFMDKTLVVNIIAEDLSSAYTIFETINNRGEDLETDELLKNFLLKRLQKEIKRHNNEYPQAEKKFEIEKNGLLEGYKYIKNITEEGNVWMQELLRYHWTAVVGTKPQKNLYKEITDYIRSQKITSEGFIQDWKVSSDCFASLLKGDNYDELSCKTKNELKLLWEMNHWEWLPVLIAARRNGFERKDFEELVVEVERTYSLFWIAGYTVGKIKNPTLVLIRDYINKRRSMNEIREYMRSVMRKSGVLNRFLESISGDCYGESWTRYALAKYEYSLTDDSVVKDIDYSSTQIEHILPQTMTAKCWKANFSGEEQEALVDTIGNLTLLIGGSKEKNKSKNQAASNKTFREKLEVYEGRALNDGLSAFQMTQELCKYDDWTPISLEKRSRKMIERLKKCWQITDEEIKKEISTKTGEENLITNEELEYIRDLVDCVRPETDCVLETIPDVVDEENRIIKAGMVKSSYVDLTDSDEYLSCGFWRAAVSDKPANTYLVIEWEEDYTEDLKQLFEDYHNGKILIGWTYNEDDFKGFLFKLDYFNKERNMTAVKEAVKLVKYYNAKLDEMESEESDSQVKDKGTYPDNELRELLEDAFRRDSSLTPMFIKFIEILLSEERSFSREEVKKALYKKGIGESVGRAGAYLSNISQFISKDNNDYLRQVIEFDSEDYVGALKDNYMVVDQYRNLIKEVLRSINQKI